jgi:hypothetical protein
VADAGRAAHPVDLQQGLLSVPHRIPIDGDAAPELVTWSPPDHALRRSLGHSGGVGARLAATMLLVWGGRAALRSFVALSSDAALALAAWPAAWGSCFPSRTRRVWFSRS